jgi:hypothetical protein
LLDADGDASFVLAGAVDLRGQRDPAGPLVRLLEVRS